MTAAVPTEHLARIMQSARQRTFELLDGLTDEQLIGPKLPTVNPLLWEVGHVAWFHEKWLLRHRRGRASLRADADRLFDSVAVEHDDRWSLPMYTRHGITSYMDEVQDAVLQELAGSDSDDDLYFAQLVLAHEDMHGEALTYTRQTLGYTAPPPGAVPSLRPLANSPETRDDADGCKVCARRLLSSLSRNQLREMGAARRPGGGGGAGGSASSHE